MKKANTTNTTFDANSMTINGKTFPAQYSLARSGDVYVFTSVCTGDSADAIPLRLHMPVGHALHEAALAAAKLAASKPAPVQAAPAPVQAKAASKPAPVQAAPAPVQAKAASKPAPVQAAPVSVQAKAASKPAPVQAAPAPVQAAPAPVQAKAASKPAPVQAAPVSEQASAPVKSWLGTALAGKGWRIAFDVDAGRTRVMFDADPTPAQRAAVDAAGFFWSAAMHSYNKRLTNKAYKAAQALASTLAALA